LIKLERSERPDELTDDMVTELTNKFLENPDARVWDRSFVREALMTFSHNKCCYCESKLNEESKYLTVDHYYPKSQYPDKVILWDNLLPACNRCNSKKGAHDTCRVPIIDPTKNDPRRYLFIHLYHYKSRDNAADSLGRATIDVLGLNDSNDMVVPRFKIGQAIQDKLNELHNRIHTYSEDNGDVRNRNRIVRIMTDMLRLASPEKEFSAVAASAIFSNIDYMRVKEKMKSANLWSCELKRLEDISRSICLLEHCAD